MGWNSNILAVITGVAGLAIGVVSATSGVVGNMLQHQTIVAAESDERVKLCRSDLEVCIDDRDKFEVAYNELSSCIDLQKDGATPEVLNQVSELQKELDLATATKNTISDELKKIQSAYQTSVNQERQCRKQLFRISSFDGASPDRLTLKNHTTGKFPESGIELTLEDYYSNVGAKFYIQGKVFYLFVGQRMQIVYGQKTCEIFVPSRDYPETSFEIRCV